MLSQTQDSIVMLNSQQSTNTSLQFNCTSQNSLRSSRSNNSSSSSVAYAKRLIQAQKTLSLIDRKVNQLSMKQKINGQDMKKLQQLQEELELHIESINWFPNRQESRIHEEEHYFETYIRRDIKKMRKRILSSIQQCREKFVLSIKKQQRDNYLQEIRQKYSRIQKQQTIQYEGQLFSKETFEQMKKNSCFKLSSLLGEVKQLYLKAYEDESEHSLNLLEKKGKELEQFQKHVLYFHLESQHENFGQTLRKCDIIDQKISLLRKNYQTQSKLLTHNQFSFGKKVKIGPHERKPERLSQPKISQTSDKVKQFTINDNQKQLQSQNQLPGSISIVASQLLGSKYNDAAQKSYQTEKNLKRSLQHLNGLCKLTDEDLIQFLNEKNQFIEKLVQASIRCVNKQAQKLKSIEEKTYCSNSKKILDKISGKHNMLLKNIKATKVYLNELQKNKREMELEQQRLKSRRQKEDQLKKRT